MKPHARRTHDVSINA